MEISQEEQHIPGELFCHSTLHPDIDILSRIRHQWSAYKVIVYHDALYLYCSMKQKYRTCFCTDMWKKIDDMIENDTFSATYKSEAPKSDTDLIVV